MKKLFAALDYKVLLFLLPRIVKYLQKRGLRVTRQEWPDLIARHLEIQGYMKQLVDRSGEIATLRVKYPKVYKKLASHLRLMEDQTRLVLDQLKVHKEDGQSK